MDRQEVEQDKIVRYVLGGSSREEELAMEASAVLDLDLRDRIEEERMALEGMVLATAVEPSGTVRERVMEAVDAAMLEEVRSQWPPLLHATSSVRDFREWINKPEHVLPSRAEHFHLVELDHSEDRETGLVWLKDRYPEEVHTDRVERILIVEGTCDVHIGHTVTALGPGGVITIPMHVPHHVVVTCAGWCKAIVQRVAA